MAAFVPSLKSMRLPITRAEHRRGWLAALAVLFLALFLAGCGKLGFGPRPANVTVKFVIYDNDNTFAATVYAQEVHTGLTTKFAYGPHTPSLAVDLKTPGT